MEHYIDDMPRNPFPEGFRPGAYRNRTRQSAAKPRRPFRERLLRACTVGGVLLAAALSVLVLDTPATSRARSWLQAASAPETTMGKAISTIWDAARGILVQEEATPSTAPVSTPTASYERIDEDILEAMQNEIDAYNAKNGLAPAGK